MLLGIAGFVLIGLVVYCLISSKMNAIPIFVAFPIIIALLCGFAPAEVFAFIKKGVGTTMSCSCSPLFILL